MTSNAWDAARDMAEKHANQGGIFVRLAAGGDKVVGAFCGEPFSKELHWTGEKYEECIGDGCRFCTAGKRPSLRVMLNFFVPAEKAMKVIEGGVSWFKDVLKVRDKYGLENWLFEIERHGDAGDPKTTYSILPEEKIDHELRTAIQAAELHDLENLRKDEEEGEKPVDRPRKVTTGTIDPRTSGELVARLKALPQTDVGDFLRQFNIQRVRDLSAEHEAAARAFVEAREAANAPAGEVDPFA